MTLETGVYDLFTLIPFSCLQRVIITKMALCLLSYNLII